MQNIVVFFMKKGYLQVEVEAETIMILQARVDELIASV